MTHFLDFVSRLKPSKAKILTNIMNSPKGVPIQEYLAMNLGISPWETYYATKMLVLVFEENMMKDEEGINTVAMVDQAIRAHMEDACPNSQSS